MKTHCQNNGLKNATKFMTILINLLKKIIRWNWSEYEFWMKNCISFDW